MVSTDTWQIGATHTKIITKPVTSHSELRKCDIVLEE